MNKLLLAGSISAAVLLAACDGPKPPAKKLESEDAKAAYSIGYMTAKSMSAQVPNLDAKSYNKGFQDAYAKKEPAIKEEDMKTILM
ncbi:MAG TPA: FKBP-type peptidyl-prolyl cis-trans isomerase N-terminal domain-containing protein, partial [Agitococcus sp.]|nr:FKBP-type peptidyl-prolyl cis-trans isomerase N-terminal domain-containing protein [Agitococcus sp.]